MLEKIKSWFKDRWMIVASLASLAAGVVISFYLKTKKLRQVLDKANEAHDKEKKVNSDAEKKLVEGLENVRKDQVENIEEKLNQHASEQEKLKEEKKEFIEDAAADDDLAEKIADRLGADFVE